MEKKPRPKVLQGKTVKIAVGCGNLYLSLNKNSDGELIEVLVHIGKAGGCATAFNEALTRSITLGLKYGISAKEYIEELKNIQCPMSVWQEGEQIKSCPDAISWIISQES
ncbi:MAG: TSCPD domain-containing protein [Alphaproteobacteria bacterium]|nr:TSCPD domain-containing protein [Alphaproteobacteria bacterium]